MLAQGKPQMMPGPLAAMAFLSTWIKKQQYIKHIS
jgi:hypothetical protein